MWNGVQTVQAKPIWRYAVFQYVVLLSVGLLLTRFLNFVLLKRLTIFLWPLLWLGLLLLAIGGIIWSIVFWQHRTQEDRWPAPVQQRWLPLLIQCTGVFLAPFIHHYEHSSIALLVT